MPDDPVGTEYSRRADFLIAMYEQLMGDINRHIIVIWQMVGVLAASVAALVLAENQGVPTSYAVLLAIVVSGWVLEHVHDSNYWYNRNLVMITNIERVFLPEGDLDIIHPYFADHRPKGSFLAHLKIQKGYTKAIVVGIMLYFLAEEIVPTLDIEARVDWIKWLPFLAIIWFFWRDSQLTKTYDRKYETYLNNSPGLHINRKIEHGTTHGKR